MKFISTLFFTIFTFLLFAQTQPPAMSASERMKSVSQRKKLGDQSLLREIPFRSVGPWVQSGRVSDIDINPKDPSVFYVSYASGGLWKTESNGAEFTPIFDREAVMTIGDIAVNWDKNIIWVGTGESISSRSSYSGVGMYKSVDSGKTWQHLGLEETHHISRVVLNPDNPDVCWVAALGHLYSPNKERGIFKTADGGKTWKNTLFIDENTGGVDIVVDEDNTQIVYAATWTKERRAWNWVTSGKGSGIYKSVDGGDTWTQISTPATGFPTGEYIGRIGLSIAKRQGVSTVWAIVDNQTPLPAKVKEDEPELTKDKVKTMTKEAFLKLPKTAVSDFLKNNRFPEKYKADDIISQIKSDKIKVQTLYDYLDTGDDGFSNNDIVGAEIYRTDDGGKSWKRTHKDNIDQLFFTYGYVFSQVRVNPKNPEKLYILGTRILKSDDGGANWVSINRENVHWDHHSLWVNPSRAGHLINGNDGGLNMSYDDGKTWTKLNSNTSMGQFFHVNVDMAEPYNVYGGLQDNGTWFGPSNTVPSNDWHDTGDAPFKFISGGDGMQTMIDNRDNATVYSGSQFGYYGRQNLKQRGSSRSKSITPKHELGEKPLRFNWMTPILLSQHNQDVLYFGGNRLYRSLDKGDNWEAISEDLSKGAKKGIVPFATITAIHESPLKFGLLYAGTDDGQMHVTKDGGNFWRKITEGVAQNMWVSRIQASAHDKATVYASLNGYRWDDFTPYLYTSNNYGETWTRIGLDLPNEPINVVKEDPKNPNILYVGTDHALYVSLDKGKIFMLMDKNLPSTPVHDLVIHPRDKELVVGTHGRSILIANVEHLQQLTSDILAKDLVAFEVKKMKIMGWGRKGDRWSDKDTVKAILPIYAKNAGYLKITVKAGKDIVLKQINPFVQKGINYVETDVLFDEKQAPPYAAWLNENNKEKDAKKIEVKKAEDGKFYLQKGKYTLEYEKDGLKTEKELVIE
jgi:photosystem II stability/assembly factor-like uncharacterized protein